MRPYHLILVLCALLAGACKDASIYPIDPQPPAGDTTALPGGNEAPFRPFLAGTWHLTGFEDLAGMLQMLPEQSYTLTFTDDSTLRGDGDCLSLVSRFSWEMTGVTWGSKGGAFGTRELSSSDRGCGSAYQKSTYLEALKTAYGMKVFGDDLWIYYTSSGNALHYRREIGAGQPAKQRFIGRLIFKKPMDIPAGARMVVGWYVESSNSYLIHGGGTWNPADSTFEVVVPSPLPESLINYQDLACGVPILTSDPAMKEGSIIASGFNRPTIHGVALWWGIFYRPSDVQHVRKWPWLAVFKKGFNIARGYLATPADAGTSWSVEHPMHRLEVVVDNPQNLGFIGLN